MYRGDCRRFHSSGNFQELHDQIGATYKFPPKSDFTVMYEDDEMELITISTDNELLEAISLATASKKPLKLIINLSDTPSSEVKKPTSVEIPVSSSPNTETVVSSSPATLPTPVPVASSPVTTSEEIKIQESVTPSLPSKEEMLDLALKFVGDSAIQNSMSVIINTIIDTISKSHNSKELISTMLSLDCISKHPSVQRLLPFTDMLIPYLNQLLERLDSATVLSFRPFVPQIAALGPTLPAMVQKLYDTGKLICGNNGDLSIDCDIKSLNFFEIMSKHWIVPTSTN